jgi:prepilin peptidase CpaA
MGVREPLLAPCLSRIVYRPRRKKAVVGRQANSTFGDLMSAWLSGIALLSALFSACVWDWRQRRIPNWLVLAAVGTGVALQTLLPAGQGLFSLVAPGGLGVVAALQAAGLMFLAGLVLWRLGLFGAGDAKLLMAAAVFAGPQGVLPLLLLTLGCGGILALGTIAARGRLMPSTEHGSMNRASERIPYSLAIAAGSVINAAFAALGVSLW